METAAGHAPVALSEPSHASDTLPFFMKEGTNGGAMDVHDSASVTFLGDLGLENIEITGSGTGMYVSNNVSHPVGEDLVEITSIFVNRPPRHPTNKCPHLKSASSQCSFQHMELVAVSFGQSLLLFCVVVVVF